MWPFGRKKPAAVEPDELLGEVKQGVLAAIGHMRQQIHELAHAMQLQAESVSDARKIETRLHRVENMATHTRNLLESELARVDQQVNQLRGMNTGALRGGRRDRQAEEIGAGLIAVLGAPERAQQLVMELQQRAQMNGEQDPRGQATNDAAIGG